MTVILKEIASGAVGAIAMTVILIGIASCAVGAIAMTVILKEIASLYTNELKIISNANI